VTFTCFYAPRINSLTYFLTYLLFAVLLLVTKIIVELITYHRWFIFEIHGAGRVRAILFLRSVQAEDLHRFLQLA